MTIEDLFHRYDKYRENVDVISVSALTPKQTNMTPLVNANSYLMYNFDKIASQELCKQNTCWHTADAACVRGNTIWLVEFKSGFHDKISVEKKCNFKLLGCSQKQHWHWFCEMRRLAKQALTYNLYEKMIESMCLLVKHILPDCEHSKVNFVVVTDLNSDQKLEVNYSRALTKKVVVNNNLVSNKNINVRTQTDSIQSLLLHARRIPFCLENQNHQLKIVYYQDIGVYSAVEFEEMIKNNKWPIINN